MVLIESTLQPVPLDKFVALAEALGFRGRGLQLRVTRFLDEQVSWHTSEETNIDFSLKVFRRFISGLPPVELVVEIYFIPMGVEGGILFLFGKALAIRLTVGDIFLNSK